VADAHTSRYDLTIPIMSDMKFETREIPDADGGLVLELRVEGKTAATARASADVLAQLNADLGSNRDNVKTFLEETLARDLKQQLAKVELTPPKAIPAGGLRFVSRYTYRDFETIYTGVVWYDVPTSLTGPEDLAAVVRNKMRSEVHRLLTDDAPNARGIVDLAK
jgi:hypothetical protein